MPCADQHFSLAIQCSRDARVAQCLDIVLTVCPKDARRCSALAAFARWPILSLEPEHRKNRLATTEACKPWEITWVLFDAQAACVFSCSASKRSSLFQSVKVMAAILRASVSRAISGFMPLASKAV
jgi:hypothetical protein